MLENLQTLTSQKILTTLGIFKSYLKFQKFQNFKILIKVVRMLYIVAIEETKILKPLDILEILKISKILDLDNKNFLTTLSSSSFHDEVRLHDSPY